jgi:hypothetical protein
MVRSVSLALNSNATIIAQSHRALSQPSRIYAQYLVLTNSKVRKLLSNFSLIGRDLRALGLLKVAEGIHPHPEALACVNDTSPQDPFITKGGRPVGPNETPELEG